MISLLPRCRTPTQPLHTRHSPSFVVCLVFADKMPLKKIPAALSPDLLHALASMGHGDDIVLADAHFPTSSTCLRGAKEIRADGLTIPVLLEAVLELLTLDAYVPKPVALMDLVPSDKEKGMKATIWDTYRTIIEKSEGKTVAIENMERFAFYERAGKAYAVVHTGETAQYGNIILKKGVCLQ